MRTGLTGSCSEDAGFRAPGAKARRETPRSPWSAKWLAGGFGARWAVSETWVTRMLVVCGEFPLRSKCKLAASAVALIVMLAGGLLSARTACAAPSDYFIIQVVDERTGRGVPLVELRTTDEVAYYTDSNGIVAYLEPGLMNHKVFFTVTSPGYEFAADGFGYHGKALDTVPGTKAVLKLKRINIAERLYRVTGAGIYRDSVLASIPVPIKTPLLNGDVDGQDSVLALPYHGMLRWFYGDTSRPDYPLGNFGMSGAHSPLSSDPDRGFDRTYYTDKDGFSRPMAPLKGPGPVWLTGICTIENGSRMIGFYTRIADLSRAHEKGLMVYNDANDTFERVREFDVSAPLPLDGHPYLGRAHGATYVVGTNSGAAPFPYARVPAALAAIKDTSKYETFTCLKPGASEASGTLDRDSSGRLVYAWKQNAPFLTYDRQRKLIAAGAMKPDEALYQIRDVETGKSVNTHTGSVYWNEYRRDWVMIFGQAGGTVSNVGEIWFAEADTPVGPWIYARKVATHPKMDFYNPTQHPFFDREGGKQIYFEGTFVNTFSGNPVAVPRYNYNQILYRLSLDDPRLSLPMPVYRMATGDLRMRAGMAGSDSGQIRSIPFYAIPSSRPHEQLVPIYSSGRDLSLSADLPNAAPVCYASPAAKPAAAATVALKDKTGKVIAYAWPNPQRPLILDYSITRAQNR